MPIDKSRLDKIIAAVDSYLKQLEQDLRNGYSYGDGNTDPKEFLDPPRTLPVSEPGNVSLDSPPSQIHGAGRKDLFS
jgi:hypothetical protein